MAFEVDASDADGDEVTYAWDFGDGSQGKGAAATHTYEEPGAYTAEVTASDPTGATASKSVDVVVTQTVPCEDDSAERGPDDEFDGDAIDGCRWDVHDYQPDLAGVRDGKWVVTTTDADFYQ
ncbi:MAG: PKD domain-containing protein, partial [Actinomycetia bacterium]|nr:PKD domain-containing protein [Actinomycetes bacterium]